MDSRPAGFLSGRRFLPRGPDRQIRIYPDGLLVP
jgi:hypothetical protein